ncbi:MAG: extracellular solute-binding protein [Pseudomonadota bacterium]
MPFLSGPAGRLAALSLAAALGPPLGAAWGQDASPAHGLAMHGDIKYGADFAQFDYADPNALKGGEVKFFAIGTYDSFNPYILRGVPAGAVASTIETLMTASGDEPFTEYCLVCETVETPADRSWVAFTLRPQARFHDGMPIEVEDVIWTFETLKAKGHPFYRSYYANVARAEKVGARKVKFNFAGEINRELPLIVGQLPVLSRAYWAGRDFERTTLEPPVGSGPYRIEAFEAGRYVTLKRVPDYWGAALAVNVGRHNFGTIRIDYYRDQTVSLEAFKAGEYDIRLENSAKNWATGYEGPGLAAGFYKKEEIPELRTTGMQGFVMNTRRAVFADPRLRHALAYAFDFEWSNRNLFYNAYARTRSYFDNSELAARDLPDSEERKLLEPFRGRIPERVFSAEYNPPKTDGSGNWRDNQREATRLMREAGWRIDNQRLVDGGGKAMSFEILLSDAQFERIALPYVENLKRLGIDARVRTVDTAQYQNRLDSFDFDMTVAVFGQSQSPGNEQRDYWSSDKADVPGSRNLAGIRDPAVDALVELLIAAPDRPSLVARTRALDRVLQWGHYVVPHWHTRVDRVASWDRFTRPKTNPNGGFDSSVWWVDPHKEAALRERRGRTTR